MSYCRLPIEFIIPCYLCDYYDACKSSCMWKVEDPDSWRAEIMNDFMKYVGLGCTPMDMCDKCNWAGNCDNQNNKC